MSLVLFGSGEFTSEVDEIDKYLIDKFKPKNVAIIPTAAGQEADVQKWIDMAKSHYLKFNLTVIPIEIFNKQQANNKNLIDPIRSADWIFFSGGNPNYLLETLKDSLLWKVVMEKYSQGKLLSGSSAGAMIMGKFILSPSFRTLFSKNKTMWHRAFDLIDYTVIPHFDHFKNQPGFINKLMDKSLSKIKSSWMGIDENTAIIFDNDSKSVHGIGGVEIHDKDGISHLKA
jgi:cyanophycinase